MEARRQFMPRSESVVCRVVFSTVGSSDRPAAVYMTNPMFEELTDVCSVKLPPGLVILDTGCRKACVGRLWHQAIRREPNHLDIPCEYQVVRENSEFDLGDLVVAEKLWTCPGGSGRVASSLSIYERAPTARAMELVPGLVGLDEMATRSWISPRERWDVSGTSGIWSR